MADPSEDEISMIIEVTGLDLVDHRNLAIQALKSNGGSVENVINEYFNDGDGFRRKYATTWDESMFNADRDGSQNEAGASFHVEAPDQAQNDVIYGVEPSQSGRATAPSRPPSRTTDRSPLGRVVDWQASNSGAVPRSHAQEEEEMQRALRESAQEAGISVPQQETGVTGPSTSMPHFGPANRDDYDASQWAMVPTAAAETPVEPQVAPSRRKREAGAPAFLVQGPSEFGAHRLGAFLTILHEIPLARNLLLQSGGPVASYGHNSQWWKGQQIIPPHVLARLSAGDFQMGQEPEPVNFEEEIHRLMAFLDSTERSYGTVSVLAHLVPGAWSSIERQFYEHFVTRNQPESNPFYSSVNIGKAQGGGDGETELERFYVIESQATRNDFMNISTLYEMLDHIMWGDMLSWHEVSDQAISAVFQDMGDILTFDMTGEGPSKSIEIPEELYPERWLESRKDEAWRLQLAWKETKNAILRVQEAKAKLYQFHDVEGGRVYDKRDVAIRAQERFSGYCEYLEGRGSFRTVEESGFDLDQYPEYATAPSRLTEEEERARQKLREAADYAQRLLDDGRNRMQELNEELKRIEAKQRFLGRVLTQPSKPGRPKPMKCNRYLLQGVATTTDVVYVCRRSRADLIELDDEPKAADQWWRLAYTPSDEAQMVKAEPLDFQQVVERMWDETKTPLLMYASEKAVFAEPVPLSSQLERFVKADNKAFRQELHQELSEPALENEAVAAEVRSPSKRKHRADSIDSMASNRASIGSEDGKVHDIFVDSDQDDGGPGLGQTQQRIYGEQQGNGTSLDAPEAAPPLPKRQPVSPENTSSNPTPVNDESYASRETQQTTPPGSLGATGESMAGEAVGPEMQERFQMPTVRRFLTGDNPEANPNPGAMDVE